MVLILCQILYLIYHKKHETLTIIRHIHVYINRINNRLVLKIKKWISARITNVRNRKKEIIWQHEKVNRQNKEGRKCTQS